MTVTQKMMSSLSSLLLALSVFPAYTQAEGREAEGRESGERDDATRRREAMNRWYNESGKPWSVAYRRFMNQAAARERARYGHLLPGADAQTSAAFDQAAYAAATGTTWNNIGPTKADVEKNGGTSLNVSDSGRPVAIVPDPNNASTLYVAMAGGGVWKTIDGGATWAAKTETLGSLSCGFLAMDPGNSSTLYLGLGDAFDGTGLGLVKSTDGGDTWSNTVYLGDSTVINSIMVAPTDSTVVLVGTGGLASNPPVTGQPTTPTTIGLYRSTDSGATFSRVTLATGQTTTAAPYIWSIAWTGGSSFALSLEANHDAVSGTTDGQVWTSNNNGASWTRASGMTKSTGVGRITVASAPSNRSILYAMAAVPNATSSSDLADFFKSTSGGTTWTALGATARKVRYTNTNTESSSPSTILNGQSWYNQVVIVKPTDSNTVYFGGALLLAKTANGGTSYTQLTNWLAQFGLAYVHADFHAAAFDNAGSFYVGTDGGIFKSTDYGTTWTSSLNVGITSHLLYSVGSSPANRDAVIGGFQDNGTRVRSGATTTYDQYIGGDGFGSHIHAINASNMLGSLYYTRIYKSTNGGTSFVSASSGITESNNSSSAPFTTRITPWAGDTTGNTVFTFVNTKVYKSTNYAGSWSALGTSGLPTTPAVYMRNFGVAKSNASVMGVVANSGRVFLSNNGGASWTQAAAPTNNGLSMSYISFDTTNPNTVYVASVAADATKNHLWKSTNFGSSWTTMDGTGFPFGIPVNTIANDPGDTLTLYAGTHLGVYRSTDGGSTWTRFGLSMPLVNVTDVYLSPDSSLVRAATFGRGFWELNP